ALGSVPAEPWRSSTPRALGSAPAEPWRSSTPRGRARAHLAAFARRGASAAGRPAAVLPKPFNDAELLGHVRRLIGDAGGR
ncbi:MAG TPA: hypothetical protein VFX28_08160, partial [Methylomirabilota bacterium]|nr:hypothetical protein [Methylomirabilota bacterium]